MARKNQPFTGTVEHHGSVGAATHGRRFPIRVSNGPAAAVTVTRIPKAQLRDLEKHVKAFKSGLLPDERRRALFTR